MHPSLLERGRGVRINKWSLLYSGLVLNGLISKTISFFWACPSGSGCTFPLFFINCHASKGLAIDKKRAPLPSLTQSTVNKQTILNSNAVNHRKQRIKLTNENQYTIDNEFFLIANKKRIKINDSLVAK
jgi:hypothetical protein